MERKHLKGLRFVFLKNEEDILKIIRIFCTI